jgi:hypothetical protein
MMSANNFGGAYILAAEGCVIYKIEGAQEHF